MTFIVYIEIFKVLRHFVHIMVSYSERERKRERARDRDREERRIVTDDQVSLQLCLDTEERCLLRPLRLKME